MHGRNEAVWEGDELAWNVLWFLSYGVRSNVLYSTFKS